MRNYGTQFLKIFENFSWMHTCFSLLDNLSHSPLPLPPSKTVLGLCNIAKNNAIRCANFIIASSFPCVCFYSLYIFVCRQTFHYYLRVQCSAFPIAFRPSFAHNFQSLLISSSVDFIVCCIKECIKEF